MAGPLTARKQQLLQTRKNIFDCATRLFVENSYEQVKISDICRVAGVSVGAFYHHFPSKESILNEGYRQFDQLLYEKWEDGHPADAREAVYFLVGVQLQSMKDNGYLYSLQFFKNQLTNQEKYILEKDRFFYRTLLEQVQQEVTAGRLFGDTTEITDEILCAARGTIYDWCLHVASYDLVKVGLRQVDMVLRYHSQSSTCAP